MHIRVLGSNMEVGEALMEHAKSHLDRHVKKYFQSAVSADVYFSKEKDLFKVNIIVNEGVRDRAIDVKGDATSDDPYGCFNEALEKTAKQLRRHKRRMKDHHNGVKEDENTG